MDNCNKNELGAFFHCSLNEGVDIDAYLDQFIHFVEQSRWEYGGSAGHGEISGCIQFGTNKREDALLYAAELENWLLNSSSVNQITKLEIASIE